MRRTTLCGEEAQADRKERKKTKMRMDIFLSITIVPYFSIWRGFREDLPSDVVQLIFP
jgi:hypothetical protein